MSAITKQENEKFCHECGAAINAKAEICPKCGVRQPGVGPVAEKSRITAALLAIFLGGIGIHKFYLGKGVQGLIYLLLCWTFIPALIALFEGIGYLMQSDAGFAAKYG